MGSLACSAVSPSRSWCSAFPIESAKRIKPIIRERLSNLRLGLGLCRLPPLVDVPLAQRAADGLKVVDDGRHVSQLHRLIPYVVASLVLSCDRGHTATVRHSFGHHHASDSGTNRGLYLQLQTALRYYLFP